MADQWGMRTSGGKYVLEDLRVRLCPACSRLEITTLEDGKFVRLMYQDDTPVLHRR